MHTHTLSDMILQPISIQKCRSSNQEGSAVAECTEGLVQGFPVVFAGENTASQRSFQKDKPQQSIGDLLVDLMHHARIQLRLLFDTTKTEQLCPSVQVCYREAHKVT